MGLSASSFQNSLLKEKKKMKLLGTSLNSSHIQGACTQSLLESSTCVLYVLHHRQKK